MLPVREIYCPAHVWGLGVPRHIFQMDACPPVWNGEYLTARGRAAADVNALREQ